MAIFERARAPKAVSSVPKSKDSIAAMELPLSDYGKRIDYHYPPENSPNRMYGKDGFELRACVVKVEKDGSASIEYEDGERGEIEIRWARDA